MNSSVETTFFKMGPDIYQQEEWVALGSPFLSVLANLYTEYFEDVALGSTSLKQSFRFSYVDDNFIFWMHQKNIQTLLHYGISIRPSIRLTMEKEENILFFLDIQLARKEQRFRSSVYRKSTFIR